MGNNMQCKACHEELEAILYAEDRPVAWICPHCRLIYQYLYGVLRINRMGGSD